MLWFRLGAVVALIVTVVIALGVGTGAFAMCINPSNAKAMNTDPYYNGTLFFYLLLIIAEAGMVAAGIFGFVIAFRVWRNNHQMDHKLRHLFTLWLAALGLAIIFVFVLGILGMVRYREPQEEIVSLYEIFSKYNQDVKFVGSFERYQRENSCCGINGPDDWLMSQFKTGGGGGGGLMGGYGGFDMSYMGSPSTGKCHLTPPTIPMGCGKKLLEEIHFTMAVYCGVLILETMWAIASVVLGWYCFFYWIEKEVIIIPGDEVSNLIIIEPESSNTTSSTTLSTNIPPPPGWETSIYSANGSQYSSYSRVGEASRYSRGSGLSSSRIHNGSRSRFSYDGRSYYPNSRRTTNYESQATKFSNFHGAVPSIGGPHAAHYPPDQEELMNHNVSSHTSTQNKTAHKNASRFLDTSQAHAPGDAHSGHHLLPPSRGVRKSISRTSTQSIRLHEGPYARSLYSHNDDYNQPNPSYARTYTWQNGADNHSNNSGYFGSHTTYYDVGYSGFETLGKTSTNHFEGGSRNEHKPAMDKIPRKNKSKKEQTPHDKLHKQEKALGGKVLAEMRIEHTHDPDRMYSQTNNTAAKKGHATIAIVKNKHPPKLKKLVTGPEDGHGQTGHLAEDILDMTGASGVKSKLDDIELSKKHKANKGGYVNKLHKNHKKNAMQSAASLDDSHAQVVVDDVLHAKSKRKPIQPVIKPHHIDELPPPKHGGKVPPQNPKHHHHHHHQDGQQHPHHDQGQYHHGSPNQLHHGHNNHPNTSDPSMKTEVLYKNHNSMV